MITREIQRKQRKTIKIIYCDSANCSTEGQTLIKAGISLLNVINALEKQGITVSLYISFFSSTGDKQDAFSLLRLKNYGEKLSLKKLSFPLANPAMFRRIGFKWVETSQELTDTSYDFGYGRSKSIGYFIENYPSIFPQDGIYYIDIDSIKNFDFNVEKIYNDINERCVKNND